ncbi:MAG: phosphoenolpyruvate synthase [Candidatus Nomurabacteria bacterium]|nr:phosphoenolpyruvate synthase [Candidatus Nomurabacteria bacterium]
MNILEYIKSNTYERLVRYPRIPVLYAEAMNEGLQNNPYFDLADSIPNPSIIVYINDIYEAWIKISGRVIVSDLESIKEIETASLKCIERNQSILEDILNLKDELSDKEVIIEMIKKTNSASSDIYKHFIFFIDESFRVSDQEIIESLQSTRLKLDLLVTEYLFPAFERLVNELVEVYDFPKETVEKMTTSEIIESLKDYDYLIKLENISARPICFLLADNTIKVLFSKEAKDVCSYLYKQDTDKKIFDQALESKTLKGNIGNQGKVRGKVRKLLAKDFFNKDKLANLSQGDKFVLVTSMTAPELVPYFKNAIAFVTDEGGITCHAAIIARELNIPCIIGTKVATEVINDGDDVEVDAYKGLVKIINNLNR